MTKLVLILCALATIAGIVWTIRVNGADGSWLVIVVPAGIGLLTAGITKARTGSFTSDSSGGR